MQIHFFGYSNATGNSFIKNFSKIKSASLTIYSREKNKNYYDLEKPLDFEFKNKNLDGILISFSPIWLLSHFLETIFEKDKKKLKNLKKIIVVSSSSVITKKYSYNPFDKELFSKINSSEKSIKKVCNLLKIKCYIIRPTLIYGNSGKYKDKNLNTIIKIMQILPFICLPKNNGLRQPIHCEQLAKVVYYIAQKKIDKDHNNKAVEINIGGDTELSYSDMIQIYWKQKTRKSHYFIFHLPNRLFIFLLSPLMLISPRYYEACMRTTTNLSGFTKVSRFLKTNAIEFPYLSKNDF